MEQQELREIQIKLEQERQKEAIKVYVQNLIKASEYKRFQDTSEGKLLISLGIKPFIEHIKKYYEVPLTGHSAKDRLWIQLCTSDIEVLAFVVISSIISGVNTKGRPLTATARTIGQNLKKLLKVSDTIKTDPNFIAYLGRKYSRAREEYKQKIIMEAIEEFNDIDMTGAPRDIRVGAIMIDLFIKSGANIIQVFKNKDSQLMVRLTPEAELILVQATSREKLLSVTNYLPMVCEPNAWKNYKKGGYLTTNIPLVKAYTKEGRNFFKERVPSKVLNVINRLQKVPFRINTKILDLISTIYTSNILDPDTIGNKVPTLIGGLPTSNIFRVEDILPYSYSKETYGEYKEKKIELEILLQAQQSKRLQLLLTLDMAKSMRKFDKFYYVYQVDYRGRVYSHINFLSPQAPAYVKSMLEFSRGEILTDEGLYWLKVHIANSYGLDKKTFEDRVAWFDKNEVMIKTTGQNPLDHIPIWYDADSPFEYVAGCIAYADYLEGKEIHLPIGLDATCSGIQFYSMLLRDENGAKAVNMKNTYDSEGNIIRADIYQLVADKVNEYLEKGDYPKEYTFTTSDGITKTLPTYTEAMSLKGKVNRSLVKRNTMTVPYSVSRRGMFNQLSDEFYDLKMKNKAFWSGEEWICLKLLTDLNYKAIYETVVGAKEGQRIIKEAVQNSKEVAKWETPIYKFPVLQPSFKTDSIRVNTPLGVIQIYEDTDELDKRAQSNAIAPNVIHSLDSTLLYYVVDNFSGDIITVHDCFLIHPNKAEEVRYWYKKGMCELMNKDVLKDIVEQLSMESIELPTYGTLTEQDIMDSKYIIS